ncbi:uncharacterized protein LOC127740529 [Arachis duranensis]|uniref:Uncharacterized protein LOC127740529 n=1 Tax=Arachis duranensis TaxID=130453 RepID=A0A9C6TC25_ARADU|nr:uncharacterized protein LOC127740529 [Arachis duranensis]
MSSSKKNKKHLSIKVQQSGCKEVISAHKTKLSHPKPTKSRAPVPSHVSKKPSTLPPSSSQPPQKFKRNLLSSHADHTPSPSQSPAESPYCSPIQPQSFDNAPNNERNLHHAHSSDENHHDESLAQEGELVTQERLLKIEPFGNEFNPCTAVRHVTNAIKSKFSEFCPSWRHASEQMRDLWFTEFKEPQHNARIRQIFEIKGSDRLRSLMNQERRNYSKDPNHVPKYIPEPVWRQLLHYFATDSKFKNWSAVNTVNRASNVGSSMHTGGSISMGEHTRRMEKATGVKRYLEEVYTKCHTKKDKNWIDERSEKVIGEFKKRKTELSQVALSLDDEGDVEASKEGLDIPDDYTIWNEVVTKEKKKAAFGLGSFGLDLSSKLDSRNCSETSKDNLNIEQELHMWKEKAKEQEIINEEQKVKLKNAEHKLKDQGRQLKVQQKRIGSTENTIHALYKKLNLPLPSTLSDPTEDELGTGSSDDNMSD